MLSLVTYYKEIGENYSFTTGKETYTQDSDSDEEQYTHRLNSAMLFYPFENYRIIYTQYALIIIKSYEEIKSSSLKLEYLYRLIFRYDYGKRFGLTCDIIHLGLFFEIVFSDFNIIVYFK